MTTLFVDTKYPFHLAEGRELHRVLTLFYPTAKGAALVAEESDVDIAYINTDQAPVFVWREILKEAAASGVLRDLVVIARDRHLRSPSRAFLDALLANETPTLSSEPRTSDGEPDFRSGNDEITAPEALLFHDDLTLEIGRVPWLVGVLQTLQTIAPSVCKFTVTRPGVSQNGTGFRIGEQLLLTNWHVLRFDFGPATKIVAEFGFDDDGKGGSTNSTAYACDLASIRSNKDDDWGVIRTIQPLPATIPIVPLSGAPAPQLGDAAFLIEHPGGNRKRIAYVRNQITFLDNRVLHYLSDTAEGSSGAPVLNDQGQVIGLHHAGGRPQEIAGKPPLVKNEGIRIDAVLKGLNAAGVL
ncbi:MAG TPA: serine protease [Thermoanaerobaculia bacterium]